MLGSGMVLQPCKDGVSLWYAISILETQLHTPNVFVLLMR